MRTFYFIIIFTLIVGCKPESTEGKTLMSTDPLNQVHLENSYFKYQGISNNIKTWSTSDGDTVNLYYFGSPPDLPKEKTLDTFIKKYLSFLGKHAIEAKIEKVANIPTVITLAKSPQKPTGLTFLASSTFPFQESSYVIKIQCKEQGTTGIREAILFDRHRANSNIPFDGTQEGFKKILEGFTPYDAKYDAQFPNHPLSRCRRGLQHIKSSITFTKEVRKLPLFDLPHE